MLISTILMLLSTIFLGLVIAIILPMSQGTVAILLELNDTPILRLPFVLVNFCMLLIFVTSFGKKVFLIIGSIIGIIASLMFVATTAGSNYWWLPPDGASQDQKALSGFYTLAGLIMIIALLFYFIGIIQYREHNKVAIFSSILLFLIGVTHNFGIMWSGQLPPYIGTYFAQSFVFFLHGLIFTFSKKNIYDDDKVEDTMSVKSGDAFASYVPGGSSYTAGYTPGPSSGGKKKGKKKKKKQEVEDDFDFDF